MYHEFREINRTSWKYTYAAKDLSAFAQAKLQEYTDSETIARKAVSALMLDSTIAASDKRIEEARKAVEANGSIREQLTVWCHEFARVPDREYHLALGDVVFFGLVI